MKPDLEMGVYVLSWARVSGAARYELREAKGEASYTEIYSDADRNHPISDKTDDIYRYQVRACHTSGTCSDWSDPPLKVLVILDCEAKPNEDTTTRFNDGSGTETDPYLICTYAQLKKMRENNDALTKHYKLGAHIDAIGSRSEGTRRDGGGTPCESYVPGASGGATGDAGNAATCVGWTPVGDNTNAFTGSLQGAGYTIQNLYISRSSTTTRVGLFGQTGSGSLIQNVGLTDAFIRVDTASSRVGSLVGENAGRINNKPCHRFGLRRLRLPCRWPDREQQWKHQQQLFHCLGYWRRYFLCWWSGGE